MDQLWRVAKHLLFQASRGGSREEGPRIFLFVFPYCKINSFNGFYSSSLKKTDNRQKDRSRSMTPGCWYIFFADNFTEIFNWYNHIMLRCLCFADNLPRSLLASQRWRLRLNSLVWWTQKNTVHQPDLSTAVSWTFQNQ